MSRCVKILVVVLLCFGDRINAQVITKRVSLGNFNTVSGKQIKNCIIGYKTMGKLKADKSNAALWPTWIAGKSDEVYAIAPSLIDTAGLYIIFVDAFGNGISSSPSNNPSFPEITIRDMVNSQYELLTRHLHISHLKILIGASMGGIQVMEWLISFPDFADYAISIVGSPELSSYDLMFWKTVAAMFDTPPGDKSSNEFSFRMSLNVFTLNFYTTSYWLDRIKKDKVDSVMLARQAEVLKKMKPEDWLSQVNAILTHDIYRSPGKTLIDIKQHIKARTLIIVSKSDYILTPQSSVDLATTIGATLLELDSNCGHIAFLCLPTLVKEAVTKFLQL